MDELASAGVVRGCSTLEMPIMSACVCRTQLPSCAGDVPCAAMFMVSLSQMCWELYQTLQKMRMEDKELDIFGVCVCDLPIAAYWGQCCVAMLQLCEYHATGLRVPVLSWAPCQAGSWMSSMMGTTSPSSWRLARRCLIGWADAEMLHRRSHCLVSWVTQCVPQILWSQEIDKEDMVQLSALLLRPDQVTSLVNNIFGNGAPTLSDRVIDRVNVELVGGGDSCSPGSLRQLSPCPAFSVPCFQFWPSCNAVCMWPSSPPLAGAVRPLTVSNFLDISLEEFRLHFDKPFPKVVPLPFMCTLNPILPRPHALPPPLIRCFCSD